MRNVYTVAQVNTYIKNMFMQDFMLQSIFIKGEISNCKYHSSGHIYFTLKDEKGTLACVMFAAYRSGLSFRMQEGQQVIVGGHVDVYERDGKYQLYAKQVILDGAGYLYERFEALKRELEERGMFSPIYKKPIPKFIQKLGVVTAPTGAAVQDIINVAKRRNPYVEIILYPAIVQGEEAAPSIVKGIKTLEKMGVDVMIVGRGGGSIEDLWAFNEEIVAEAVFDCEIPIISAVGHETDTTIIDYVSDLRAPTPSAAAELAVYDYQMVRESILDYREKLCRQMLRNVQSKRQSLQSYQMKLKFLSPAGQIRQKRTYLLQLEESLQNAMNSILIDRRHKLEIYIEKMKGLSPLEKLNQGFSYVKSPDGKGLKSISQVKVGDTLQIHVTDGKITAKVTEKEADYVTRGKLC
ncbi:MAG: exodeoxyribonuclease VII large subunit [Lachnospiraceae bacterium]|nr:exodeoxyribonuclease VII large subunit [Lachnospiraceae bacterium]